MAIEPLFENLSFTIPKKEQIVYIDVSAKSSIDSNEIERVLSVFAVPLANETKETGNKIELSGKVVFYVNYNDQDGEIKKSECNGEYLENLECDIDFDKNGILVRSFIEKCEHDISNGDLILKAKIKLCITIYSEEKLNYVSGGEGLIVESMEEKIIKSLGLKKTILPIEEEFELSYQVKEVLSQSAFVNVTAVQCGVNCIIVDGEIFLSLLLLQNLEKSDIIRENKSLPFRVEIDYEESMPTLTCIGSAVVKSVKTDVEVDGESGKSIVKTKVGVCFYGEAFSEENVVVIKDVFSKEVELETEFLEQDVFTHNPCQNFQTDVIVRAETEELPAGIRLMAVGGESVEIVSASKRDGGVEISGVISLTAFFRDSEGKNSSAILTAPFTTKTNFYLEEEKNFKVYAVCKGARAKIVSLSSIEISLDVIFKMDSQKSQKIKCLKGVLELGAKAINDSAISVFIPQENEELWSLSKRLNVCPEELLETNRELQFPLTGKERIVIYRPKIN